MISKNFNQKKAQAFSNYVVNEKNEEKTDFGR